MRYMIISLVILVVTCEYAKSSLVTIEQGILNGTHLKARDGKLFNAFYGIPYAQPPVGKLRFKPPVEAEPWIGIRDATQLPPICVQVIEGTNNTVRGTEDCLYLDVHTPLNAREGSKLPVIVFIFGGKFKHGYTFQNGPQKIMQHDVIIVYPNFRLGALGFLSTGDTVIPGNFALKDQTLALKWVQKNIHSFGGDPDHVTLQGHSSGAMCVHFHTLSPASKGLFHKIIIQSGLGFPPRGNFGPDVSKAIATEFGVKAGCPSVNSSQDMYDCFMNLEPNKIALITEQLYVWDLDPDAPFRPTVEDENAEQAFLTGLPNYAQYQSNDMPWMIGMTSGEAAFKVVRYLDNDGKLAAEIDKNSQLLFPITLQYLWNSKVKHLNFISRAIRTYYFGNRKIGEETAREMTSMYTDGLNGVPMVSGIYSYAGPKHVYLYDYPANNSMQLQSSIGYYDKLLGISHGAELELIFEREDVSDFLIDRDLIFGDELVKRWINFVYTSDPNKPMKIDESIMGFWKPMSSERIEYMYLNYNGTMRTDLLKGTYQFWNNLPLGSKYYKYSES